MRALRPVLVALLLVPSACNQPRPAVRVPTVVPTDPAEPPPLSGEASVSADELHDHVMELASDDYAGRATLTAGAERAAAYLEGEYQRYGLAPLPGRTSLRVPYAVEVPGYDAADNHVVLRTASREAPLEAGVDFTPFDFSDDGTAAGDVVFAGYGLPTDYDGLDVNGKVVLVLRHSALERREREMRRMNPAVRALVEQAEGLVPQGFVDKAREAQSHGAAAMLLVTDPLNHGALEELELDGKARLPETDEERAAHEARMAAMKERAAAAADDPSKAGKQARNGKPANGKPANGKHAKGPARRDHGAAGADSEATLLAVHISQASADELLADSGHTLVDLQRAVNAGTPPRALALADGARAELTVARRKTPRVAHADDVIAYLEGSDPALRDQWVVVGAHYDHLGSTIGTGDTVYNGADDNASGTSAVLELAQAFAKLPAERRPHRSLVFMSFSGEELGLLGSRALASQKLIDMGHVVFMLNLDMIGRNGDKPVDTTGDAFATDVREITDAANADLGVALHWTGLDYAGNSDHDSFFRQDVPMMFFFTGFHADYHGLGDHANKLDYGHMELITRLSYRILERFAVGDVTPRFLHDLPWLGATLAIDGDGDAARARLTRVEAGSRGEHLGLQAGDAVVAIAGEDVAAGQIGRRLDKLDTGKTVAVTVERDGARVDVSVTRPTPPYLGVWPRGVADDERAGLALASGGLRLAQVVPGGPADKSGLVTGDVVVTIDGKPVDEGSFVRVLLQHGAGDVLPFEIIRAGARQTIQVTLGERPGRRR